jgi:predicted dehydrogenase
VTVVVVGAGEIGSRHLQGLAHMDRALAPVIWAVDPDDGARRTARARYEEVSRPDSPDLELRADLDGVPGPPELVVVATTARHRADIVEGLLRDAAPAALVLEKVLFQRTADLDRIGRLLADAGVPTWVNLPRRYAAAWDDLAARAEGASWALLSVSGGDWGLACNAVHLLDMVQRLGGTPEVTVDGSLLDPGVVPAKRSGYYEVQGTLGARAGAVRALLTSAPVAGLARQVTLETDAGRWHLETADGAEVVVTTSGEGPVRREHPPMPMQSRLSGQVATEILTTGTCRLPDYRTSARAHRALLPVLLDHFPPELIEEDRCPIT